MSDRQPSKVFVGRERELEQLLAAVDDANIGRGSLFLISGEPGVGKSRLADEVTSRARERGHRVLWGRAWEAGGAPAYWPWTQALRAYLREADPEAVGAQVDDGGADVARLLPELREMLPGLPEPSPLDPDSARFRLFDATSSFLRNAADDRPILLALEDLHVADTPSLLLLQFLASNLAESRLLVLGTYRDVDPTLAGPLSESLAQLAREKVTRFLPLRGLTQDEVGSFIEQSTVAPVPPSMAAAIHAKTGGNALFVVELVRLLAIEGRLDREGYVATDLPPVPPGVREVIRRRLGRLSDECNTLLTLAAVLGSEFDLDVLSRLSGRGGEERLVALQEAVAARIVTDVPGALGRLRFSHALIRDVIYEAQPATERVLLHRRVADSLEAMFAGSLDAHLVELAHHAVQSAPGGDAARAVEYARRAGHRAMRMLAYEEAVRLLGMALEALPLARDTGDRVRLDLLLDLGDARARAGDGPGARETFLEAAALAGRVGTAEELGRAALGYGGRFVWARKGDDPHLVPLLQKALSALGDVESELRVRLLARLAGALRDEPSREPRTSLSEEALTMARRLGDPLALAWALDGRYASLLWPENAQERIGMATELCEVAESMGDQEKAVQGRYYRLMAQMELGDTHAVRAELDILDLLTRELRQPAQRWLVTVTRATLALFEGRFEEAEPLIAEALALGERAQSSDAVLSQRIQLFTLHRERGSLKEVEPLVERSVEEYRARPMFRCMLALVHAETGRTSEARRALDALAEGEFAALPRTNEWLFSMSFLTDAAAVIDHIEHAPTMYDLLLPYASHTGATADYVCTGSMTRSLGILATAMSRWREAERHLEEALSINESMAARPWAARTRHDLARMLLARDAPGDRERASDLLSEVIATCGRLGMASLQERARTLAEGSGIPATADSPSLFHREGDYWSIEFEGRAFRLRDLKGLHYLARMLAEPGREFHVLDLAGGQRGGGRMEPGLEWSDLGDAGEILDPVAKESYRRRLADLEEEAETARTMGDPERAARADEEREAIVEQLAGALGLGGRDRRAGSASERARAAVTRAVRAALGRITEHHAPLGRHLERTIRTGTFCSYAPDPRAPVAWRV